MNTVAGKEGKDGIWYMCGADQWTARRVSCAWPAGRVGVG